MSPTTTTPTDAEAIRLSFRDDGIAVLHLAGRDGRPFILDAAALSALESAVGSLRARDGVRGLAVLSGDDRVFCAGADVDGIAAVRTAAEAGALSKRGQDLFLAIDELPFPVVAAIHGTCVGGGLELALAADIRVVSDDPSTRLGLPEVRLGILPAWGGTTRLPEVVGLRRAAGMILAGETLDGRRARKAGLAIECVPKAILAGRAFSRLEDEIAARAHGHHAPPDAREPSALDYLVDEMRLPARLFLAAARARVMKETRGHYPAPLAILDVLGRGLGRPREERFRLEREAVAKLAIDPVAKNLIGIFRRSRDKDRGGLYARKPSGAPIARVAVCGAGVMGAGIASLLLQKGRPVLLLDAFPEALVRARRSIEREITALAARRRIDAREARSMLDRLSLGSDWFALRGQDLVIEAVPEIPAVKHEVLRRIASAAPRTAIIASNTSSLSLAGLAADVANPERFAGLHFFNPAPKMPLVEIVRHDAASEETLLRLLAFSKSLGKTPVVCTDRPAFVVNRILAPYLLEAIALLGAGAGIEEIDRAARRFGLPMGPFELMDEVGLDTVLFVCRHLSTFPELGIAAPLLLERLVDAKRLGRKGGAGFHDFRGRKRSALARARLAAFDPALAGTPPAPPPEAAIRARLEAALATEAARVLAERVVESPDDLDLASIYGMGFPPFRGGIATWAAGRTEAAR